MKERYNAGYDLQQAEAMDLCNSRRLATEDHQRCRSRSTPGTIAGAHCWGPSYPRSTKYQPYLVILYHSLLYFPQHTMLDQIPRCIPHFFIQSPSTTKRQRNSCRSKAWQPFGLLGDPTGCFFEWNSCKQGTELSCLNCSQTLFSFGSTSLTTPILSGQPLPG